MKAKFLKPGTMVEVGGRLMTFVRRDLRIGRCPINVFQCPDYIGLTGPYDSGLTEMNDRYFAKHATRIVSKPIFSQGATPRTAVADTQTGDTQTERFIRPGDLS